MSETPSTDHIMLNAATTGSASYVPRPNAQTQQLYVHYINWATGVTAGTVVIETADSSTYAGTWAPIATIVNNGGGTAYIDYVQHPGGGFKAIRHRVSVTVSGGGAPSVTTRIEGVNS